LRELQLSIWWNAGQSITSYAMAETSGVWRGYSSVFANVTADVGSPPLALTGMMDATWTWVPGIIHPELEISLEAGNMVITWQAGTLVSSPTITGAFTPVAGAANPYQVTPTAGTMFYRVQQ
jgi:hypothetical protein